jgi:hypothetical protein
LNFSVFEYGLLPVVLLVLYALVDKVVVPLVARKNGRNGGSGSHDELQRIERRVDRNADHIEEMRRIMSEIRADSRLMAGILERVEKALERIKR